MTLRCMRARHAWVYMSPVGIVTQFLRLHEAALRKNVADNGWRLMPRLCTATTRVRQKCGCEKSFGTVDTQATDGLRQGRYAQVHWRKGTWSQMPVME